MLGKRFIVKELKWSGYSAFAKVKLKQFRVNKNMYAHPKDLSTENTYVDPKKDLPKYYRDIDNMKLSRAQSYKCYWLIYKDKPKGWWKKLEPAKAYADLEKALNHDNDPCERCWDHGRCDLCEKKKAFQEAIRHADPMGWNNTNHACFAAFSNNVGNMKKKFKTIPDRMMVKLDWVNINVPLTDPEKVDWEDVCNYFKYMVKGKCLPSYI